MTLLETIVHSLSTSILINPYFLFFLSFVLIALWGDASMVLLMILGVGLKLPLWIILVGAYFGAQFGDFIWFILGRKLLPLVAKHERWGKHYIHLIKSLNKIAHKSVFITLTVVKFLYGTRVITVMYLSHRKPKLNIWKFLWYNSLALILWLAFMGTIGYLVAIGFSFIFNVVKDIQLAVTLLILFFIIFNIVQKFISKKLEK